MTSSIQGKLSTLTAIADIGHGFFKCSDKQSAAMYICVQTRKLIPFQRSIIAYRSKVLAVSGQSDISKGSNFNGQIKELCREIKGNDELSIHKGILPETSILHIPLKCPTSKISWDWFIEINDIDKYKAAAELFARHFSEGLLHLSYKQNFVQFLRPLLSLPLLLTLGFILACFTITLPEKVIAPLIVKALHSESARASIEGLVLNCVSEGKAVNKGEVLASLDVTHLKYQLSETLKSLYELKLKIGHSSKDSLKDNSKLVEIQVLKNEQEKLNLKIDFLNQKISKNKILAPINGVVRYLPEISQTGDHNTGRLLHHGDVLCTIDDLRVKVAEISISENDIHALENVSALYLYYHTAPDIHVTSEIVHIPERPSISPLTRKYVYQIQSSSNESIGVTGTAHLQSQNVKLGYYLFKKVYFYLRAF
ncbi:MAG: hypothetical protein NE328_13435 [Lentisphaeraceae bacterium]|nr:hypothetical protein [Lentisphaeraceae bacterium]